jgi:cytochrome c oxidase subunit II
MIDHRLSAAVVLSILAACGGTPESTSDVSSVKIAAMQWRFDPPTVMLEKGTPVDLELTSVDVHHRFYLPDFGVDVDLVPGMTTKIRLTPGDAGTFHFRCEYYCGQGHEGMVGHLVVR